MEAKENSGTPQLRGTWREGSLCVEVSHVDLFCLIHGFRLSSLRLAMWCCLRRWGSISFPSPMLQSSTKCRGRFRCWKKLHDRARAHPAYLRPVSREKRSALSCSCVKTRSQTYWQDRPVSARLLWKCSHVVQRQVAHAFLSGELCHDVCSHTTRWM